MVDSTTIKAKKGFVNYYEHKRRESSKVHVTVTVKSLPLSVVTG
jgi:hypothetical protein